MLFRKLSSSRSPFWQWWQGNLLANMQQSLVNISATNPLSLHFLERSLAPTDPACMAIVARSLLENLQQSLGNISATKPLSLDYPESCPAPEVHPGTGSQSTFLKMYSCLWATFLQLNLGLQTIQKCLQLQQI